MNNYKMVVEYDGGRYDGWQRLGKDESSNTVENKITEVLNKMTGGTVELFCGSRTEKGVHAYGQVVSFKCETEMKCKEIQHYLNRYLPRDIAVIELCQMPERFHASLNAKTRTYVYRIDTAEVPNVFERRYMYNSFKKLDVEKMEEACGYFEGVHDFGKFTTAKRTKSTIKEIFKASIYDDGNELVITLKASDFLHNMTRLIFGALIEIGNGRMDPKSVSEMLNPDSQIAPSVMAEPNGMFLQSVEY